MLKQSYSLIRAPFTLVIAIVMCTQVNSQTPLNEGFTYQGRLKQNGAPLNGVVDLQFSLWADPVSQNPGSWLVGAQVVSGVQVTDGLFTVFLNGSGELGNTDLFKVFDGTERWLQIDVDSPPGSSFITLSPRQALTAAPYASTALTALSVDGVDGHSLNSADGSFNDMVYVDSAGNVGVRTNNPAEELHVMGDIRLDGGEFKSWGPVTLHPDVDNSGDDVVRFVDSAGAETMRIASDGRVGIGSSSPPAKLSVMNLGQVDDAPIFATGELHQEVFGMRGDFAGGGSTGNSLRLNSLWNPQVMTWRGDGFVGIGTNAPKQQLHVSGDYYGKGHVWYHAFEGDGASGTAYIQARDTSGTSNINLRLRTQNAGAIVEAMTVTANGSVGIGTAGPPAKLSVMNMGQIDDTRVFATGELTQEVFGLRGDFAGGGSTGNALRLASLWHSQIMTWRGDGYVGIGTNAPTERLDVNGAIRIRGGSDLAEPFNVHGDDVRPGMVVAIDPNHTGEMRIADRPCDPTVAGIISGANGVRPGLTLQQEGTIADGKYPVALSGRVYCWVDADAGGAIRPGDMLTTSATPGHAMCLSPSDPAPRGSIIGKAMSSLESGQGLVLVLVNLQ